MFNQLTVTAVLVLRMLPWEGRILLHRQRCESTCSCVFISSGEGSEWGLARSCSSSGQAGWRQQIWALLRREKWDQAKGHSGIGGCPMPRADPALCVCAWTHHSRGKVLITQLLISDISVAVPFGRGKTIKQADMNNLLVCLDDSCQDQQSHVIYLSTCVISFFFPLKEA